MSVKLKTFEGKFVIKPIYGAGSFSMSEYLKNITFERLRLFKIILTGIKGSFSMLCKNKNFVLISCNKQIIKIIGNNIIQRRDSYRRA